jgi:dimethylsulfone monooxygenase
LTIANTVSIRNPGLRDGNAFKLGLFGPNCSGGLAFTRLPERWDSSWDNNLALAQLADAGGIECLVPIARWKGLGGATNFNGSALETITWACALLAHTRHINAFGTVHAPMIHPIVAAKQMSTADHVSRGRFGLNIVCGWNEDEFDMFGATKRDHNDRYDYGEEWWRVVKQIWAGGPAADFARKYFNLKGLEGQPLPFGGERPLMMNAGASPTGRNFAIRNSDLHFDYCRSPADSVERVKETKRLAREGGRDIQVWMAASVICRTTKKEADDYTRHCAENADWEAVRHHHALYTGTYGSKTRSLQETREFLAHDKERVILGYGGSYSIRGDADYVAGQLKILHDTGFSGVAIGFVNFLNELPFFLQEVVPRLERMGLRSREPLTGQAFGALSEPLARARIWKTPRAAAAPRLASDRRLALRPHRTLPRRARP